MQFTFTFDPATDLMIGGEPAKVLPETYRDKSQPNAPAASEKDWIVNHGGRAFYFSAAPIGTHSMDVDTIIASVTFLA